MAASILKLPEGVHFDKRMGNQDQAIRYCSTDPFISQKKDPETGKIVSEEKPKGRIDGPWKIGAPSKPGARTDIEEAYRDAKKGLSRVEMLENHTTFMIRNHGAWSKYRNDFLTDRDSTPVVKVYYGKTRCGKSTQAEKEAGPGFHKHTPNQKCFWSTYDGQDRVIIDEFNGQWPIEYLLGILDCHSFDIELKGGFCKFRATKIWITSQHHPLEWYPNASKEHMEALAARIDEVKYFDKQIAGSMKNTIDSLLKAGPLSVPEFEIRCLKDSVTPVTGVTRSCHANTGTCLNDNPCEVHNNCVNRDEVGERVILTFPPPRVVVTSGASSLAYDYACIKH